MSPSAELSSRRAPAAQPQLGLRERKKLKTKEAIQREAMRLFQKQGYEDTTIEQIAGAAEISPSTFFNYFPTKEDVVLFDRYDPIVASLLTSGPPDEPFSKAMRRTLHALAGEIERDRDITLARARIGLESASMRARLWEELEKAQTLIGGVIAHRTGRKPDDFELRLVVMVFITATFEATQEWVRRNGAGSMFDLVDQALEVTGVLPRIDALEQSSPKRTP